MDSLDHVQQNDVSDPLKHLLSLEWESNLITTKSKDLHSKTEQSKSVKKVRFSDEIGYILCDIDTSEINSPIFSVLERSRDDYSDFLGNENLSGISDQTEANAELIIQESDDGSDYLTDNNAINYEPDYLINENTLAEIQVSEVSKVICISENENSLKNENADLQTFTKVSEIDIDNLTTQIENVSIHPVQDNDFLKTKILPSNVRNQVLKVCPNESSKYHIKFHSSLIGDDATGYMLQKKHQPFCARKSYRIQEKLQNEMQSIKLNSVLTKNASISNASELKTSVFKAWFNVKNKTKGDVETLNSRYKTKSFIEPITSKNDKEHVKSPSNHAFTIWKKSKNKAMQIEHKEQHKNICSYSSQELSGNEEKERELAFKSWKKRKDEILKKRYMNEKIKEQKYISLTNDSQKKKDSEAAFLAWEAHKSHQIKTENKKKAWLQKKEKEEYIKKSLRDKEALEMYYLWLDTKHFACEKYSTYPTQLQPPWIPPGKSHV